MTAPPSRWSPNPSEPGGQDRHRRPTEDQRPGVVDIEVRPSAGGADQADTTAPQIDLDAEVPSSEPMPARDALPRRQDAHTRDRYSRATAPAPLPHEVRRRHRHGSVAIGGEPPLRTIAVDHGGRIPQHDVAGNDPRLGPHGGRSAQNHVEHTREQEHPAEEQGSLQRRVAHADHRPGGHERSAMHESSPPLRFGTDPGAYRPPDHTPADVSGPRPVRTGPRVNVGGRPGNRSP
jgi:hypothetical protein